MNVTEDGKKALVTLANGDMRKVLNILQVGTYQVETHLDILKNGYIVVFGRLSLHLIIGLVNRLVIGFKLV